MKIIQLNIVYPHGSTGKIVMDLHNYYTEVYGYESHVLYGLGNKRKEKNVIKTSNIFLQRLNTIYTYLSGYMYKGSLISTYRIIRYIKNVNPDIVHLHSINGHMVNMYILLEYLNKNKISTVITNHGEFFYTGSYTHVPPGSTQWLTGEKEDYEDAKRLTNSWFFDKTKNSIDKFFKLYNTFDNLIITSVSPWVEERAKKSYLMSNLKHRTVLNGIDTSVFRIKNSCYLYEIHNIKEKKIILHITSQFNNPLKGSDTVIELANKMKDFIFVIIGKKDNEKVDLPQNCINIGVIKDQDILADYYNIADVTLITSKMETFSMIVAESLSCGTPVVGYMAGGPESIAIKDYTKFVYYGDIQQLENSLLNILNENINREDVSIEAKKRYSKEKMAEEYLKVYKDLLDK